MEDMIEMSWYCLTLTSIQVAAGEVPKRKGVFLEAFSAAGGPRIMALFQKEHEGGGVDLFFTPDCGQYAAEILEEWGCIPCDRPPLVGLHLLVGHNEITYYLP